MDAESKELIALLVAPEPVLKLLQATQKKPLTAIITEHYGSLFIDDLNLVMFSPCEDFDRAAQGSTGDMLLNAGKVLMQLAASEFCFGYLKVKSLLTNPINMGY